MSLFSTNSAMQPTLTTKVHRPMGGIAGVRELHDDISCLTVLAFPMAIAKDIALASTFLPACYILADHKTAYIGETTKPGRRLADHAADASKDFAREGYVFAAPGKEWFDRGAILYLQHRMTTMAQQAGLVEVVKGVNPQLVELAHEKRASLDHLFSEYGERLLFDAGCRVFHSNFPSQRGELQAVENADLVVDGVEARPMKIGVIASPPLGSELELAYGDLWARGFPAQEGFVVMAGSEVRGTVNPSVTQSVHTRRADLAAAEALAPIRGLDDRSRLRVAVWFESPAIAAKILTGAHVDSSKWQAPRYPRPIVIAA
jgi:hypothetical protein